MKAKIVKPASNAQQPANKETIETFNVIAARKGELENPVTARLYMGRSASASVVYACIWIRTAAGAWTSGRGSAGGYGYHKGSAAIDEAIRSAGVVLTGSAYGGERDKAEAGRACSISGVGDSAIEAALLAIARAAGYRGALRIVKG